MAKVITQHRRGTTAEWELSTVVLADGELVIEICDDGSRKTKIGDGIHTFAALPYTTDSLTEDISLLEARVNNLSKIQPIVPDDEDSSATLDSFASEVADIRVGYDGTIYANAGEAVRDLGAQFDKFRNAEAIDGLFYEDNMLYLTANGGQVLENTGVEIIGGSGGGDGGGGGSTTGTVVKLTNEVRDDQGNKTTIINAILDSTVQLKFTFTSTVDDESTGNGTCGVTVNGISKVKNYKINNGVMTTLDISEYLVTGNNTVKLTCTDAYGTNRTLIYTITILELDLSSTFNSYTVYSSDIDYRYRVTSLIDKATVYFYLTPEGGEKKLVAEKLFTVANSGKELQQTIPVGGLPHGITTLEVYAVAEQDGGTLTSNVLKYDLMIAHENEVAPMIASVLNVTEVNQGDQLSIPYVVYDPQKTECTVLLQISVMSNGEYVVKNSTSVTVDKNLSTWNTRNYPEGDVRFSIVYYSAYDENNNPTGNLLAEKHHYITVNESIVNVEAEENPVLYLSSVDRSNDANDKDQWAYTNQTTTINTAFDGFNWKSNGWLTDTNGNTLLRLNGGATATINYFPFASLDTKLLNHGMTFEFEYAIRDLSDRTQPVISCCKETLVEVTETSKNEATGETITTTKAEKRIVGIQALPDRITFGSTHTNVTCTYKDKERLRVSFVVEQDNDESSRFISAYVDGTLTAVENYTHGSDSFNNDYNIVLGGEGCTLDVYSIRIYDRALSAKEILNNYIADETNVANQIEVYTDNDIYDSYGRLSYDEVKARIPTITFIGEMPKSKGDKKLVYMDFVNPFDHSKDFINVYGGPIQVEIDVQGTSSQYYVRKNWKVKLKKKKDGVTLFDHEPYQHMDDEVPAKVFCIKVDYAEGTGTHNTQNANFAETLYSTKVPAQYDDARVRTTIAGFPCAIFERESETSDPIFSSKGNFNFDKDAEEAFGFTEDYDVECWEFCNNVHDTVKFLANIDPLDWAENFEPRCYYPKYRNAVDFDRVEDLQDKKDAENSTITEAESAELDSLRATAIDRFKRMHDWVVSTTGNVDKFKNEFESRFNLEYALIYYVYTFFALMTDQRAKNMFLTYWGERVYINETTKTWMIGDVNTGISAAEAAPEPIVDDDGIEYFVVNGEKIVAGKWYPYLYDNDTCYGIDNSGNPVFEYYHEDIDTWDNGQKLVYNGQESILWINFRQAFSNEIKSKYAELRSEGKLTYDAIYDQFIEEGAERYSASIYNEDAEYKYLCMARPKGNGQNEDGTWKTPDVSNLYQVKGDGKHQLKYFLENRIKYCDSKWHAGSYPTDIIYLRINEGEDYDSTITVTPFSKMYCGVQYGAGSSVTKIRCNANESCSFEYSGGTPNDLETTIFGASELSSVGDLSRLYCSRMEFREPTKLKELIVGSSRAGYSNSVLKALSLNNLPLLQKLDITNCSALEGNIDCSPSSNIQEIYALGANTLSGVTLSDGGYVRALFLPESISELSLKSQHELVFDGSFNYSDGYGFGIGSKSEINCQNIEKLCIYDCPNIDSTMVFNKCISYSDLKLKNVRVNNLHIEVDSWAEVRKYYLPKQSDVGAEDAVGTSYFVGENGNYFRKVLNSDPVDTGIPATAGYGYGLRGIDAANLDTDEIYLSGKCIINQDMDGADMAELVKYLPYLDFETGVKPDGSNYKITSTVFFLNNDGTKTLASVDVISTTTKNVSCEDPISSGKITLDQLAIPSIVKYDYEHNGWSINPTTEVIDGVPTRKPQPYALQDIVGDRYLYPTYTANIRYYPIEFYDEDGTTLLHRDDAVKYYENESDYVQYPFDDPEKDGVSDPTLYPFAGWNPDPIITEDNLKINNYECVKVYALFKTLDEQWEIPTINEITYTTSNGKLSITGRSASWADDPNVFVRIPDSFSVSGSSYATDSITGFGNFETLRLIDLPNSLTQIPFYTSAETGVAAQKGAFENCALLEEVNIPINVKDLGYHTFVNCPKLRLINYNAKDADTSNWDDSILSRSGGGKLEVVIGETVEKIPSYGLASTSTNRATINKLIWSQNNNCKAIVSSAFSHTQLNASIVQTGVDDNGAPVYSDEAVFTLPEGLETIQMYAFQNSGPDVRVINFPTTLKLINNSAFADWKNLTEFNIPSATTIEPGAFSGCAKIENIDVSASTKYDFTNGCLTIPDDRTLVLATKSYTGIPEKITSIANNAFDGADFLDEIDLINIMHVGQQSFKACPNLTTVKMTNNVVQTLGNQAFYNCINLESVTLSINIAEIPAYGFYGTKLNTISIPSAVKKIGEAAFRDIPELTSVEFVTGSKLTNIARTAFSRCSSLTDIALPASVTTLGDSAFEDCTSLRSVTLSSVSKIYGKTFSGCSALTSITIPDSVTSIVATMTSGGSSGGAFRNCLVLKEVVLGAGLTASTIANKTFENCVNLTSIKTKLSEEDFGTVPADKWGATNATIIYNYEG